MKKALSLILALVMCLSLCACGGGNDTPETTEAPTEATEAPTEAPEAQLSKEELIANAIKTDVMTLQSAAVSNRLKAKQDYCNKPIIVTGTAMSVNEEYVQICDSQASVYAYLAVDELIEVTTGKNITVVGIISDLKDVEETIAGTVWKWPVYVMDIAYMVIDTFDWVAAKAEFLNNNCDFIDANIDQFTQLSGEEITDVIVGTWTNKGNTIVFGADGTLTYSDGSSGTWSITEFSDGSRLHTWTDWKIYHLMDNIYYMRNLTTGAVIIKAE